METFLLLPSTSWFEAPEQTDSAGRPNGCRGEGFALPGLYVMVIKVTEATSWKQVRSAFVCVDVFSMDASTNRYWGRISSKIRKSGQRVFVFIWDFIFFFPMYPVSTSIRGRLMITTDGDAKEGGNMTQWEEKVAKNSWKSHMTQNSLFRCFLTNTLWISGRLQTETWTAWGCYTAALGAKLARGCVG